MEFVSIHGGNKITKRGVPYYRGGGGMHKKSKLYNTTGVMLKNPQDANYSTVERCSKLQRLLIIPLEKCQKLLGILYRRDAGNY